MISGELACLADQVEARCAVGDPPGPAELEGICASLRDCATRAAVLEALPVPAPALAGAGGDEGNVVPLRRPRPALAALLIAAALAALAPRPAAAFQAPVCAPDRALRDALLKLWDQRPLVDGLTDGGSLLRVFVSPDGSTWSLVMVSPDGEACLTTSGRHLAPAPTAAAPS